MTAVIVTLADEVTEDLNKYKGQWQLSYNAERKYAPAIELEQTDVLKVTVAMAAWRKSPDNRAEWEHEFDIEIGVQYRADVKFGDEAKAKFDDCLMLTQQISDHYEETRPTLSDCVLTAVEFGGPTGLPYVPDHIRQFNQFTGVVTLTFGFKMR